MSRLRRLPPDFRLKRRGFRSPERSLAQGARTEDLLEEYALARRAGAAVMPVVRAMRLPLDFSGGRGVRIENQKVVLITDSAAQLARLRNLSTRLLDRLVAAGVPVLGLEFRLRGRKRPAEEAAPAEPVRSPSLIGSALLAAAAKDFHSKALREQVLALSRTLAPEPGELPLAVLSALDSQKRRLEALLLRAARLEEKLPDAPDPMIVPTQAEAEAVPELAGVRTRQLARIARRRDAADAVEAVRRESAVAGPELERLLEAALEAQTAPDQTERFEALSAETVALSQRISEGMHRLDAAQAALERRMRTERLAEADAEAREEVISAAADLERSAALRSGLKAPPPNAALRGALRLSAKRLRKASEAVRRTVLAALDKLPPGNELPVTDEKLSEEVAALGEARRRGASNPEEALSPETTRRILIWNSKRTLEARLKALWAELERIDAALTGDAPQLRAPRSFGAAALAADFAALQAIDRRHAADAERLVELASRSETLEEEADVLRASLPEKGVSFESPDAARLARASEALAQHLTVLRALLGGRPNADIIPTEAEAAGDEKAAQARPRMLERLALWDAKAEKIAAAARALADFRSVFLAPTKDPLSAPKLAMLEKSLRHGFALDAEARSALGAAGEAAPPLDFDAAAAGAPDVPAAPATPPVPTVREAPPAPRETPRAAASGDRREDLEALRDILPVWRSDLPKPVLADLVPSEEDAAARHDLAELRARLLERAERRRSFSARIDAIESRLAEAKARLGNPLSDAAETQSFVDALLADAEGFSKELAALRNANARRA